MLEQALHAHRSGDLATAEATYRKLLDSTAPVAAEAHHLLGMLCAQTGRTEEGLTLLRHAITLAESLPRHDDPPLLAKAWHNLGLLLRQQGDPNAAVSAWQQALAVTPTLLPSLQALPPLLAELGRTDEALAAYRTLLARQDDPAARLAIGQLCHLRWQDTQHPDDLQAARSAYRDAMTKGQAAALFHLGILEQDAGELDSAIDCYRQLLAQQADHAEACYNLGVALQTRGDIDGALAAYSELLERHPDHAGAAYNRAVLFEWQARPDEAITAYRHTLTVAPGHAAASFNLANLLRQQGGLAEAIRHYRQALEQQPENQDVRLNLAVTLALQGERQAAREQYEQLLAQRPDHLEAHYNLGNLDRAEEDFSAALAHYDKVLAVDPTHVDAQLNRAASLQQTAKLAEAIAGYRHLLQQELRPEARSGVWSNLLLTLSHDENQSAAALAVAHREFGVFASQAAPPLSAGSPARTPLRRLRLGLLSADLRQHPVCEYLSGVLQALPDSEFELFFFANQSPRQADAMTARLQALGHWRQVEMLDDAALCAQIRQDGIDILIDLSGHTAGNRLLALARQPAPLQCSWVGYFASSGLPAMNYLIGDARLFPASDSRLYSERVIRLPAAYAFTPSPAAPEVSPLPALQQGGFTFGSFNRPAKIGPAVLARWAAALLAVPDARLVLGSIPEQCAPAIRMALHSHGILAERLSFLPPQNLPDYLAGHAHIDLLLDTAPFAGGATTHHAAWMGVPILTLPGDTPLSRQGAALMQALALPGFIARDDADFAAKAAYWATHRDELAAIRGSLRERCRQAAPFDPARIATALTRGLRQAWQDWCAGRPATDITID